MKVEEIIKKYQSVVPNRKKGINVYSTPKSDLIRLIQNAEGNNPCYQSNIASSCGQTDCCWYSDCKRNSK